MSTLEIIRIRNGEDYTTATQSQHDSVAAANASLTTGARKFNGEVVQNSGTSGDLYRKGIRWGRYIIR